MNTYKEHILICSSCFPENQQGSNNQRPSSSSGSNMRNFSSQQSNHRPQTASDNDSFSSRGVSHFNSGPPHSRSQPNSASSYRGGGSNPRDGIGPSRSSDSNFHSQDSGYKSSSDHGGGGRDSRGGGGGGQHNDDFSHNRRQQNLPPRLANKLGRDGNPPAQGSSRPASGRYQENSYDSRTQHNGGEMDHPGANQINRGRPLREQNSDSRAGSNYAGGYNGQQQSNPQKKQPDYQGNSQRMQGGGGQKPRFEQQRQLQQQGRRPDVRAAEAFLLLWFGFVFHGVGSHPFCVSWMEVFVFPQYMNKNSTTEQLSNKFQDMKFLSHPPVEKKRDS